MRQQGMKKKISKTVAAAEINAKNTNFFLFLFWFLFYILFDDLSAALANPRTQYFNRRFNFRRSVKLERRVDFHFDVGVDVSPPKNWGSNNPQLSFWLIRNHAQAETEKDRTKKR